MSTFAGSVRTLLRLALSTLLAGALLAGVLLPWVGGPALLAAESSNLLGEAPGELTDQPPAGNTTMLAANGELIISFYEQNRAPVTSDQIADVMKRAMVAIEDSRFYEHHGLDVQGTLRALVKNMAAGDVQEGGSTLTQQLVKQTLLQTAATPAERDAAVEQSVGRKLHEARLALALEQTYSKDEILTRYLNIVYFGQNAYGIQAAAHAFFGVDASALTLPQAALLAGLVQSPTHDNPLLTPEGATVRRNQVLTRMAAQKYITAAERDAAIAAPLGLAPSPPPRRGCVEASVGPYVCDFVQRYLIQTLHLTQAQLEHGGYTIRTTLDPELQRSGDAAVLKTLSLDDNRVATFNAVEPGTGHLLALSVNRVFGYDRTDKRQESYNLNWAPSRGAGSTYKVFVAAAALARGYSTSYTQTTSDPYLSRVYKKDGGPYRVSNAGHYRPTLDLTTALYQSSNTYFVALEDALGSVEEPVHMAETMGLYQFGPADLAQKTIDENRGSFTLGPDETSPLALASAYSTLAAGGTQCDVNPVTAILDAHGQPLTDAKGNLVATGDHCTPAAIPPGVANTRNQMLRKDVEPGNPGQTASRAFVPGHQIAGKTGTTQNNWSVAFVGYTPEITASVMVFDPKENRDVGGFGGGKGATVWHDAMAPILQSRGSGVFPPADPAVVNGNTKPVPGCSTVSQCRSVLAAAGFRTATAKVDSDKKDGDLAGTSPPRGGRAVPGQLVTILVSNGSAYTEPAPEPPAPPGGTDPAAADPNAPPVSPGTPAPPTAPDQPAPPGNPGGPGNGRGQGPPGRLPPGQT